MGTFTRSRNPAAESRMLTFISPPVGAYTQALQDYSAGDPEGAMRHDAVWACVNKIALSMAMMRPIPYKGPMVGHGQAVPQSPPMILTKPGANTRMTAFTYAVWVSKLLRGNAYGMIASRDGRSGRPTQIELQHPDQMRVKLLPNGEYEYKLRNELVDPYDVWHESIFAMPGSRIGMSVIRYAATATRTGQLAEKFGENYFQDGGHPTAILTNTNAARITQEQAQTVKDKFMAALHGSREPVVMAQGWEYQQVQIKPEESQFLNTQQASAEKICRFFGMKPQHIGLSPGGSSLEYSTLEDNMADFLTYPLTPWIAFWEEELADLVSPGQYVKCDTSPLLRTGMLQRMQAYHMMIGSRAFTQDEIREMEDKPPLTSAQKQEIDAMPAVPPVPGPKIGL